MLKLTKKGRDALDKSVSQAERDKAHAAGNSLPDGSYPINNTHQLHSAAVLAASGHGDAAAAKSLIRRRARQLGVDVTSLPGFGSETKKFDTVVPLIKSESQQIVYGVVLTPDLVDSQGDIVPAAEIENAAHRWLVEYRKHDVQHNEQAAAIDPVESFIAPVDFKIEHETVLKGSWVMAAHVSDSETWERIEKGDITGFSIGGSGERIAE